MTTFFTTETQQPVVDSEPLRALEAKLAAIEVDCLLGIGAPLALPPAVEVESLAVPTDAEKAEFYRQFEEWRGDSDGSVGMD